MFHANYHLATNMHSSPPLDSVDNTHDHTAHVPSPPSPSLQSDIMPGIPPLLCPHPKCVDNTCKIAPQIPSPPSTHVEPRPSSSRGNKHLQFQLTNDDDDKPPNTAQMTKKRTAMKVMMIGPNVQLKKSHVDNATDVLVSGAMNGKGKGKAVPKPKGLRS